MSEKTEKLRELVAQMGCTHAELAEFLSVSERTIYRWLAGDTDIPQLVIKLLELEIQIGEKK